MSYYSEPDNRLPDILPLLGVFAAGLLIGGLAGTVTMLLIAPQSGQRTRRQLRRRALELRDQVADNAEEAREKAEERLDAALDRVRKVKKTALDRVDDVQQASQDMLDQQRERVSAAVETGKKMVRRRQANGH